MKRMRESKIEPPSPASCGPTTAPGEHEMDEILSYLMEKQSKYPLLPSATATTHSDEEDNDEKLVGVQTDVTKRMRSILIDWLVEVAVEYSLADESLFLAISLLDRFLAAECLESRGHLQLLGITCMLIAGKFEEVYCPTIDDYIFISDNIYHRTQVVEMERRVLAALNYDLCVPTCYTFLRHFWHLFGLANAPITEVFPSLTSQFPPVKSREFHLATYVLELAMINAEPLKYLPSEMATAAILFVFRVEKQDDVIARLVSLSISPLNRLDIGSCEIIQLSHALLGYHREKAGKKGQAKSKLQASKEKYERVSRFKVSLLSL